MTAEQFNEKYKNYLEKGHYGLSFDHPEFTEWLDEKFQQWIKRPGFSYSQIKVKFGMGRFYAESLLPQEERDVENYITNLFTQHNT